MLKGYYHPNIVTNKNTITRCTVYYEAERDTIKFSVAFCSPKDRFTRKLGNTIAYGRFQAGEVNTIFGHDPFKDRFEVLQNIELHLENDETSILPRWFGWFIPYEYLGNLNYRG